MLNFMGGSLRGRRAALLLTTMLGGMSFISHSALAQTLPSGGKVTSGSAVISTTGTSATISQSSGKAIITWNAFSIGQGDSVQFNNGSGATLNRVTGGNLSSIDGLLSATGSVYLINPNGVVIGKSGVVKTGGSFVASALDVSDNNFLLGGDLSFSGHSTASVVNLGSVGSLGGNVVLIGSTVENDGSVTAANGTAGLVAGQTVLMKDTATDQGLFTVQVGGADTSITNTGTIAAASAELRANGGSIYALAGNTTGIITATGVGTQDGHIWLTAGNAGTLSVDETLKATQADGDGGTVETSAGTVDFNGVKVDTTGITGKTGTWLVDPYNLTIDMSNNGTINGNLASTNITLQTTATGTSGNGTVTTGQGDIDINAELFWSNSNTLTIDAYHGIKLTAPIIVYGPGHLVLKSNDGGTGGDLNFTFGYSFEPGGSVTYTGTGGALTINGQAYTLIYSMSQLDALDGNNAQTGVGTATAVGGYYALAVPLNASGTTYGSALIGTEASTPFSGVLEGLGNSISNLTISGTSGNYMGLVGYSTGTIRDLELSSENLSFTGAYAVGGLVGWNAGTLDQDLVSGNISNGGDHVGGLAAVNYGGTILDGTSDAIVTAEAATYSAGGVVGYNTGTIEDAVSQSNVTQGANSSTSNLGAIAGFNSGTVDGASAVSWVGSSGQTTGGESLSQGGLVGWNTGTVRNSVSLGQTVGSNASHVGGLVGVNLGGTVSNDYAYMINVTGNGVDAGGIVGWNSGTVDAVDAFGSSTGYANGSVTGTAGAMGGVVGWNQGGVVEASYTTAPVSDTAASSHVGDLVGVNFTGGEVENSYATGTVTSAGADGGGLVGYNAGTVSASYATGAVSVTATGASVGGLIGINASGAVAQDDYATTTGAIASTGGIEGAIVGTNDGTLSDVYGTGALTGAPAQVGGVSGVNNGTISGAYWDTQTTGVSVSSGAGTAAGTGLTTAQFSNSANFSGWSFTTTPDGAGWVIVDMDSSLNNAGGAAGGTRPMLASEYSTAVSNAHQLQLIAMNLAGTYTVTLSSDAEHLDLYETGQVSGVWKSNGFIPMGTAADPFSGTLNGSTDSVINLHMNSSGNYAGLIGYNTGTVDNFQLQDVSINSTAYATGGLVGWNTGTLADDYVSGAITAGGDHVGGMVGVNSGATITGSETAVGITATTWSAGGFVGYNSGTLSGDQTSGNVADNGQYAGGAVGYNAGGTINNIVTSGNVTGTGVTVAGGVVGYSGGGSIINSAAGGIVTDTGQAEGGLIGWNEGATLTGDTSYATVAGTAAHAGGLVGVNDAGTISSGAAEGQVTASGNDAGGFVGYNNASLSDDYVTGGVSGGAAAAGGFAGWNTANGTISISAAIGYVTDTNTASHVGGLIGVNYGGTVSNVYAKGPVSGSGNDAGGLVGYNTGTISYAYAANLASGTATDIGAFAGYNSGTITDGYWQSDFAHAPGLTVVGLGSGSSSGITGLTFATLTNGVEPKGFSLSVWVVQAGQYPYLGLLGQH